MSLLGKFAGVGGASALSRVAGFIREALIGAILGAGPVADAFYAAFRFPNLFRRLFAEGAFNSGFIPLLARELDGGGQAAAERFASQVLGVLLVAFLGFSALAILFMPALTATIIAPAFRDTPDKFDLTVMMGRIMFPYLLCMSLMAVLSGLLNASRRYFLAALVPVLLNLVLIAGLGLSLLLGWSAGAAGVALAAGVLVAGPLQFGLLWWSVRRAGFSLRIARPRLTPPVKRLLVLTAPAVLTGGMTQINLWIGQIIASAQDGAIAILNYADRVVQLPLGVIGVAVGVVLLPELTHSLKGGEAQEARRLQDRSLQFALGLTLPATAGLLILPSPIIALLYERGAFTGDLTSLTGAALAGFAIGLPAHVLVKVFNPAFYARQDMRRPLWFCGVAVLANLAISLLLFPRLGHVAIALATSAAAWINAVLLAVALWIDGSFRPARDTLKRIAAMALATAAMSFVVVLSWQTIEPQAQGHALLGALALLGVIALGMGTYGALAILTGALDRGMVRRLLRRAPSQQMP